MRIRTVVALVAVSLIAGSSLGDGWSYHYFKERVPLALDPTLLAVRIGDGASRAEATAALASLGIPTTDVREWAVEGWLIVETAGALQRGADAASIVRDAGALAGVELASPVFVGEDGGPLFPTADVLVRFGAGVADDDALRVARGFGEVVEERFGGMDGAMRVRIPTRSGFEALDAANALAQRDDVVFAEPDMVFTGRGALLPNDPGFPLCWGLRNTGQFGGTAGVDMDAANAWEITLGDPSVLVVVIDTGVELSHPDLNSAFGADFTSDVSTTGYPVNQWDNHGTPVAGCVSARINNGLGTVGIAPGVRSCSARSFVSINSNGNWTSSSSWTVNALEWAESTLGARVTNNSNGYGFSSGAIASKYADTRAAGIVHFASAGNDGVPASSYPASLPTVNSVAALAPDGDLAGFSNYGPGIAFSAPGQTVYSTDRTGAPGYTSTDYTYVNGTSFAAPYAAGVAALILSENPAYSPAIVEGLLATTAEDLGDPGYDEEFGWGLVHASNALGGQAMEPSSFGLMMPGDDATNVPLGVTFTWESSGFADEYELTIATDAGLSGVVFSDVVSGSSLTVPNGTLSFGVTYHWTVEARNALGATVATGGPWSFSTGLIGDASGDCEVNFTDLNYVIATFGTSGPGVLGDTNGDNEVNFTDLNNVLVGFGTGCATR